MIDQEAAMIDPKIIRSGELRLYHPRPVISLRARMPICIGCGWEMKRRRWGWICENARISNGGVVGGA